MIKLEGGEFRYPSDALPLVSLKLTANHVKRAAFSCKCSTVHNLAQPLDFCSSAQGSRYMRRSPPHPTTYHPVPTLREEPGYHKLHRMDTVRSCGTVCWSSYMELKIYHPLASNLALPVILGNQDRRVKVMFRKVSLARIYKAQSGSEAPCK